MNKESVLQVLQEIKAEQPNFFCSHPLHILTWKSKKIEGALITKVNGQRYLGLLRKDSQGQAYWRYRLLTESSNSESGGVSSLDSVAKFQQRQEKVKDYGKSEQSVNEQSN